MPLTALKIGRMWPNNPESCVEVVELNVMNRSAAWALPYTNTDKSMGAIRFISAPYFAADQYTAQIRVFISVADALMSQVGQSAKNPPEALTSELPLTWCGREETPFAILVPPSRCEQASVRSLSVFWK